MISLCLRLSSRRAQPRQGRALPRVREEVINVKNIKKNKQYLGTLLG